jgi:hypothetical protein
MRLNGRYGTIFNGEYASHGHVRSARDSLRSAS